ncbi:hypothetical protein Hanom_Chr04g00301411 [Helianthus anomalus]
MVFDLTTPNRLTFPYKNSFSYFTFYLFTLLIFSRLLSSFTQLLLLLQRCVPFIDHLLWLTVKDNLAESVSVLTQRQLDNFIQEYRIPLDLNPVLPSKNEIIYPFRQGKFPFTPVFPSPSGDERSSLKNWKDHFFWLDDRCLPTDMVWRFKDQTMSFDLGEEFVFNKELARALVDNISPIRPLGMLFLGPRGQRLTGYTHETTEMSLRDALKILSFNVLDFDFDEQLEGEVPFMKQVSGSAHEIRPLSDQSALELPTADATSIPDKPVREVAGSSGSQVKKVSIMDDVDSDPEVRSLYEALAYKTSDVSLKSKGVILDTEPKGLVHRKRKTESVQIRSSPSLPIPKLVKRAKGSSRSHSSDNIVIELDEHLSGGNSSREEAALARSALTPAFSSGFLPVNETENMEVENLITSGKGDGDTQGGAKVVTFSGTILDSSLGTDCFIDDEEDEVSSLPLSWFGTELMSFFRYVDVFSDDMEVDPNTADDNFIPEWDIHNEDSVMNDLTARMFLFNINTPLDHARSRKMKNQDLGAAVLVNQAQSNVFVTELYRRWIEAESVKEGLEKEALSLKRKMQRTPDAEKRLAQLSQDLQVHKEKIKSLTTQTQSSQATAASASEERDKIVAELKSFVESSKKKDVEHKEVLAKMEEAVANAHATYEKMLAERDALIIGEADLKARIEEMKGHHKAEIQELKLESADLEAKIEDLQATKTWLLSEGAQLLAKNIHKGPEMTTTVAAVNNAMSAMGVNSGLQNGYVHALKKKTPYAEVPLLNRNAEAELNTAVACFDSLTFPVVEDLPKLFNEPLSKIKDTLFFVGGGGGGSLEEWGGHAWFLGACTCINFSWLNF